MKNVMLAAGLASMAFSLPVMAKSPDWSLVEVGYSKAKIEDTDLRPAGASLMGTFQLGESMFVAVDYSVLTEEIFGADVDLDLGSVGIGYRYGITDTTDFYAALSYEYIELAVDTNQGPSASEDENGFGITAGVRSMLGERFELGGAISYIDIDGENETGLSVSARYYFTEHFAAGANYSVADDVDMLGISLRYAF